MTSFNRCVAPLVLALSLAACQSTKPETSAGLTEKYPMSASATAPDTLVYRSPDIDIKKFTNGFYVAPVEVYSGTDAEFGDVSAADREKLAQFLRTEFIRELGTKYKIAGAPGPGVVELKLTLAGISETRPLLSAATRLSPAGLVLAIGKSASGMPAAFTGSVTFGAVISDGGSGQTLGAFLTRVSPNALDLSSALGTLEAARIGITRGAEGFRAAVDRITGKG
ncbi:MAG: DUF3313 domain-containing protein [Alphaproteobacteria bacterium]